MFVLGTFTALLCVVMFTISCSVPAMEVIKEPTPEEEPTEQKVEGVDYFLPHIDLSHWKVTLPIGKSDRGKTP